MKLGIPGAVVVVCALSGLTAEAHHSFAGTYQEGDLIRLQGTIVQFNIRNPHSFINFEVVDEDGNTVLWGGEWGSVTALSQGGVDRFTLKPGERIIVDGAPPRDSMDRKVLIRRVERPATDRVDAFVWEGRFQ